MARPAHASLLAAFSTVRSILKTFGSQELSPAAVLAIVIFLLAILFSFLAFTPVLSAFVYPLF